MDAAARLLARRSYLASVAFVDEWVGRVLAEVDRTNTWVLFGADHGDNLGDNYLWRKVSPNQASAHVPMMVSWPTGEQRVTVPRGAVLPQLVELRDVFPTLAHVAGAPLAAGTVEGASLACLLGLPCPGHPQWRTALDLEHDVCYNQTMHWSAVVAPSFLFPGSLVKYIFWATTGVESLFNLSQDPHELVDLSTDPAWAMEVSAQRAGMGAQFIAEGRGPAWVDKNGRPVVRPLSQPCSPNYPAQWSKEYC